ncbi:periplasmic chaperone for outer membrane proteins SurA [Pseudoroseicyclus aestuarii]|uniref:Parvulin-like PPIase n=1 Tax=Pseudoroseicyclus aestuarii TaxID=1795041 RepID=A0A318STX7_9RHOB|nr:periplasmic chaperone for outer membrane proteins SurA [Pseudoroseicyclus aestuarii]
MKTLSTSRFRGAVAALALAAMAPAAASAQSAFSPAITVDGAAITYWEIDQRVRLLQAFNTPGDLREVARQQLVEERLKGAELERQGLTLDEAGLREAQEEFAGRANLTLEQFRAQLSQDGIAPEAFRDYVSINLAWRDYIRARFGPQTSASEEDILRQAMRPDPGQSTELLLSEIIIATPPQMPPEIRVRAREVSQQIAAITSADEFSEAARQVSALPSREDGGRLGWVPVANYPAPIVEQILELSPGQVTQPIQIPNGIALFQLRGQREVDSSPAIVEIDYAAFAIPGPLEAAQEAAGAVAGRVDVCDDLYGVAQGLPPERLVREAVAPAALPDGYAAAMAPLDGNEYTLLPRADGGLTFLMLCARRPAAVASGDAQELDSLLRGAQLQRYDEILLAELRAQAIITGE